MAQSHRESEPEIEWSQFDFQQIHEVLCVVRKLIQVHLHAHTR